jgi:hypothetical protein
MDSNRGGIKIGIAKDAIKPKFIKASLNKLSQRSKKVFLIRNPIMEL